MKLASPTNDSETALLPESFHFFTVFESSLKILISDIGKKTELGIWALLLFQLWNLLFHAYFTKRSPHLKYNSVIFS